MMIMGGTDGGNATEKLLWGFVMSSGAYAAIVLQYGSIINPVVVK